MQFGGRYGFGSVSVRIRCICETALTVNDARCTNQLETANAQRITMNKWLFHQNGFTRTSFTATVTVISNFVEENVCVCVCVFYIVKAPSPGGFSNLMPNTTG